MTDLELRAVLFRLRQVRQTRQRWLYAQRGHVYNRRAVTSTIVRRMHAMAARTL